MYPLVTIVIPMRNAEAYIEETIDSILRQDYQNIEILVVDDGSTDGSRAVVESYEEKRIKVIDGNKRGISDALNVGFESASGEILMRCDADDLMMPLRITQQTKWLMENPEFDALCGSYMTIDHRGRKVSALNTGKLPCEITEELRMGKVRSHLCAYAFTRKAYVITGGFRSEFETGEDIDFQLRLGETCRVFYQPIVVYRYRLHNDSITHSSGNLKRKYFDVLARKMQKERQDHGLDCIQKGLPLPSVDPSLYSHPQRKSANQHILNQLIGEAWRQHGAGQKSIAVVTGLKAVRVSPISLAAWKSLIMLIIKV